MGIRHRVGRGLRAPAFGIAVLTPVVLAGAVAATLAGEGVPPDGGYPDSAYRAIFGVIGASLAAGLLLYARGADAPPRPKAATARG